MTLKDIDYLDNQYYVYNRRLLCIVGLWPYQKISIRVRYAFLITIIIASSVVTELYLLLTSEVKLEQIMEHLIILLPTFSFGSAYFNLLFNPATMKVMLGRIRNDLNKVENSEEFIVIQTYAGVSKLYSRAIICLLYLYAAFRIVPSILYLFLYLFNIIDKSKLILPIHSEIFLINNKRYFFMFFFEPITIIILCTIGIAHHSVFMLSLQHACALFIVVTTKINEPFKKDEHKFDWPSTLTNNNHEGEIDWIITVIKNWKEAINFVEVIKLLYGRIYLIDVIIGLLFIFIDFLYFFQLINFLLTVEEALKVGLYVTINMLITYFCYTLGQKLIDHSSDVYTKCCMIPFYILSNKTNKLLLIFLMASMKPRSLSIGGIFVASYELLTKVIQAAFSFATVCYNMR